MRSHAAMMPVDLSNVEGAGVYVFGTVRAGSVWEPTDVFPTWGGG